MSRVNRSRNLKGMSIISSRIHNVSKVANAAKDVEKERIHFGLIDVSVGIRWGEMTSKLYIAHGKEWYECQSGQHGQNRNRKDLCVRRTQKLF